MTGKYQPKRNRETGSFFDVGMEVVICIRSARPYLEDGGCSFHNNTSERKSGWISRISTTLQKTHIPANQS